MDTVTADAEVARTLRAVIGMETSGMVRDAVIALGHDAISVDLLEHQRGGAHHVGDLFAFLAGDSAFDFGVFHPECTYHTGSAAWAFKDPDYVRYPGVGYHQRLKPGTLFGKERRDARDRAEDDVRRIRALPFPKVIENPVGTLSAPRNLGPAHQIVQPYEFGADASKKTCLWFFDAHGNPMFTRVKKRADQYVKPRLWCPSCDQCSPYDAAFSWGCIHCGGEPGRLLPRWGNQTDHGQNKLSPALTDRWKVRSDTYPGIAAAIAEAMTGIQQ